MDLRYNQTLMAYFIVHNVAMVSLKVDYKLDRFFVSIFCAIALSCTQFHQWLS